MDNAVPVTIRKQTLKNQASKKTVEYLWREKHIEALGNTDEDKCCANKPVVKMKPMRSQRDEYGPYSSADPFLIASSVFRHCKTEKPGKNRKVTHNNAYNHQDCEAGKSFLHVFLL